METPSFVHSTVLIIARILLEATKRHKRHKKENWTELALQFCAFCAFLWLLLFSGAFLMRRNLQAAFCVLLLATMFACTAANHARRDGPTSRILTDNLGRRG